MMTLWQEDIKHRKDQNFHRIIVHKYNTEKVEVMTLSFIQYFMFFTKATDVRGCMSLAQSVMPVWRKCINQQKNQKLEET